MPCPLATRWRQLFCHGGEALFPVVLTGLGGRYQVLRMLVAAIGARFEMDLSVAETDLLERATFGGFRRGDHAVVEFVGESAAVGAGAVVVFAGGNVAARSTEVDLDRGP